MADDASRLDKIKDEAARKLDEIETGARPDDRTPLDRPGVSGGTAGTGGENKVQDPDFEH